MYAIARTMGEDSTIALLNLDNPDDKRFFENILFKAWVIDAMLNRWVVWGNDHEYIVIDMQSSYWLIAAQYMSGIIESFEDVRDAEQGCRYLNDIRYDR